MACQCKFLPPKLRESHINWEAIGAIGEFIGALAVVVSVVYLAVQIRQNTNQVQEQVKTFHLGAHNAAAIEYSNFRQSIIRSPQVASLWRRGKESFKSLDPDEKAQLNELFNDYFWAGANVYLRNQKSSTPDNDLWSAVETDIAFSFRYAGIREWWAEEREAFPDGFMRITDGLSQKYES